MHWRQLWENMLPEINPGLYTPFGSVSFGLGKASIFPHLKSNSGASGGLALGHCTDYSSTTLNSNLD